MVCTPDCPLDNEQFDEVSPGPIENREAICRGGYGPKSHYSASGQLRHSLIRADDLLRGCLSVWRLFDETEDERNEIVSILKEKAPPKNSLWDVTAARAESIRSVRVPRWVDEQVLHVFDDCRVDENGGKHPKHAAVSICEALNPSALTKEDLLFIEIRDELFRCLKKGSVWSLPAGERR